MELSDFKIRQVVLEVRYDDAFALWDCAGRVHQELSRLWPGTTLQKVAPNEQLLRSDRVEILTGIKTSRVALLFPASILAAIDPMAETVNLWVTSLNIAKFNRVGTRVIFARSFSSEDAANKAVVDLGLVRYPTAPIFNHKGRPYENEVRIRWQDTVSQTQVLIKSEHQEIEMTIPSEGGEETQKKKLDFMLLDVDRATKGTIQLSKFRTRDWLEGVQHVISRDAPRILKQT